MKLLTTLILSALSTNCFASPDAINPGPSTKSSTPIKIAAVLSLTGMASAHGEAIREGLEYAKSVFEA